MRTDRALFVHSNTIVDIVSHYVSNDIAIPIQLLPFFIAKCFTKQSWTSPRLFILSLIALLRRLHIFDFMDFFSDKSPFVYVQFSMGRIQANRVHDYVEIASHRKIRLIVIAVKILSCKLSMTQPA